MDLNLGLSPHFHLTCSFARVFLGFAAFNFPKARPYHTFSDGGRIFYSKIEFPQNPRKRFGIRWTLDIILGPSMDLKECVEDPVANGLSLMNQILYIKKL